MTSKNKRDLLIHYDESRREIIFYTVASDELSEVRKREFDGARSDIEWFQNKDANEAEKDLGSLIFSLLDGFSTEKIGIRDYKSLNQEAHKKFVADLEVESDQGSAEAKYLLFIEYHSKALKYAGLDFLKKAEEFLRASSSLGHDEASNRLNEDWAALEGVVLRKIERVGRNK